MKTMAEDGDELARRLESFRNYLLLLARVQLDDRLRGHLDPDDLVQQTLTRALEKRDRFRGSDDAQRAAWLRRLLSRTLIDAARKFARAGGGARSLEAAIEQSPARRGAVLAARQVSPSGPVRPRGGAAAAGRRPGRPARRPAAGGRAEASARARIGGGGPADGPVPAGGRGAAPTGLEGAAGGPGGDLERG